MVSMAIKGKLAAVPVVYDDGSLDLSFPGMRVLTDARTEFVGPVSSATMLARLLNSGDQIEAEGTLHAVGTTLATRVRVVSKCFPRLIVA